MSGLAQRQSGERGVMEMRGRSYLAKESYVLLAICLVDMLFTGWLIHTRRGIEGNPLMSFYLQSGWPVLIAIKLTLMACPILIAEWARRIHPVFVHRALRFAIVAYLSMYAIAFVNAGISAADRIW
jgi:hypothetical protein